METFVLFKNSIIGMFIGTAPVQVAGPVGIAQMTESGARRHRTPAGVCCFPQHQPGDSQYPAAAALDGGRIAFVLLEWVRRGKRISPKVEGWCIPSALPCSWHSFSLSHTKIFSASSAVEAKGASATGQQSHQHRKVTVGGDAPITVQSMTKTDTRDVKATVEQIRALEEYGCEIIRVAVPDAEAARAIANIKKGIFIPLIADIHFDYRLALAALKAGCDGLRINPGNIGEAERVKAVVLAAKERQVPIRIGVNAGSIPKSANTKLTVPRQMVAAAMEQVKLLRASTSI